MKTYLIRRLLQMIPLFFGITIVSFSIVHLAPGSPVDLLAGDPNITPEDIARMEEALGLNRPIHIRYFEWVGDMVKGDFGNSFRQGKAVSALILERLPNTMILNIFALLISLSVSIPVGIFSAIRQYSLADYLATFLAFFGVAMPNFWLALLLLYLFWVRLQILPGSGRGTYGWTVESVGWHWYFIDRAKHMILPVFVLSVSTMASFTRFVRTSMLQVIREDYVRTARAKGLSERVVIYKHALRNAMIPLVTILAMSIPGLIGGSVVIEQIFSWPGVGSLSFNSVMGRDYNVVMAFNTITAMLTLVFMLLADIAYVAVDPRIRFD
ncbi:ABC transporter permease [Alkalicella caledoniensis]|uniref:ABC transporter permease n=1 Tax=Alkalicella caledoniensis TaxID=2731377 RepID=A0A7G9WAI0_ALKCA|nr:ABC transporter permease [Alkalicella caledoniensis]QNO15692.1 ABC transporter permease [Alkalicella caledoniensis]